jgi:hypothetical protein
MWPGRRWRWLTALLLATGLAGCKGANSHAYPSDPLLVSKKPLEVTAQSAPPARSASADTVVPPSRAGLIAACSGRPRAGRSEAATEEPPPPSGSRPSQEPPRDPAPLTQARASSAAPGQ